MIDLLEAHALLNEDEKPVSKPYRSSGVTVRDFRHLPYEQRAAIDRECDQREGLNFTTYAHSYGQPYTVGRRAAAL